MFRIKGLKLSNNSLMILSFLSAMASGFFLSGADIAGVASFADISLAGALGVVTSPAVLAGSLLRCIVDGTVGKNIVKIIAMIIIVITKLFSDIGNRTKACGFFTAFGIFVSGMLISAVLGEFFYKLLFYLFYSVLSGLTAYSASLVIMSLKKQFVIELSGKSGCAYALVYIVFMSALCGIEIYSLNIGMIIGTAVTLLASYYYGHTGGALCGALTSCGAFLASSDAGMTVVLLPVAGLMTGYIHRQRTGVSVVAFVSLSFMLMVLTGITKNNIGIMLNIVSGAVLFAVIAPCYSDKWVSTGTDSGTALPDIINARMSFLSDSIGTVRAESGKIAEVLAENSKDVDGVSKISSKICSNCYRNDLCWGSEKAVTQKAFAKLSRQPEITYETFPYELQNCLKKEELIKKFAKASRERMTARILRLRSSGNQQLLSEQIKITEEIIRSVGERIDVRYSEPISRLVTKKLSRYGIVPKRVIAYYNIYNRLIIELYFITAESPASTSRICDLISDELEMSLDITSPAYSGREMRFRLFEQPQYAMEVYGASMCAKGSDENGDTSTVFTDGTGIGYVILSDGMGSGKSASLESKLVVKMFRKLINSGVGCTSAIKLINSIMVAKSGDESFATLDAVRIDLDSCGLTVIKSGASATLIRHRGNILKVTSPTFPIGIYEQSDVFTSRYSFEDGDMIVMFSDGIDESQYKSIKELLLGGDDVKKIVCEICEKAESFNPSVRSDDVTVIGIRVRKRERQQSVPSV